LDTRKDACSFSINICEIDGEIITSIINPKKITRFKYKENSDLLMTLHFAKNLNTYFKSFYYS
ncbi:MAG TPA: hypothetical protein VIH61_06610, partial [Waddliaceae bacterium]